MFPFFETIRYQAGSAANLFFHQQRVERTFLHYGHPCNLNLLGIDFKLEASKQLAINDGVYKCRISYDLQGNYQMVFEPYQIRPIKSFTLFDIQDHQYNFKFTDRTWINQAAKSVQTDDLIFVKDGFLKDASYANIALFDGQNWVTPAEPLLAGTKRAKLLTENKLIEQAISVEQLKEFQQLKFINAMMDWEESPTIHLL